jgi:hypothetical protein
MQILLDVVPLDADSTRCRSRLVHKTCASLILTVKWVPFFHETFARGENKNRTLCKEGTVECALKIIIHMPGAIFDQN